MSTSSTRRYGTPDPAYDGTGEIIRETGVRLATVLPQPGAVILYVYDFGDYWQHDLRLEAVFVAEPGIKYPRVLDGARSCPPEDCGGAGGYADLLEILLDPTHEEFEHMRNGLARGSTRRSSRSMPQMNVCRKIGLSP